MMSLIVALLSIVVSLSGYPVKAGGHVDLCNGVNVDNVGAVVYVYPTGYILHMAFDEPDTFILVYDDCFEQSAIEVSPDGFAHVDF